ncbi:hypothetical protein SDC9_04525 [bioreactor metagenome]|uniref:Uncharacterized protein n=1 Tax=bioreactor metagenome TaxID=1076179 RepID=A0A644SW85_9ZZZZ
MKGLEVFAFEDFLHFAAQKFLYPLALLGLQFLLVGAEEIILEADVFLPHFGEKDIVRKNVDIVDQVIGENFFVDEILDGVDVVIDEDLLAPGIPGEAPDPVVDEHHIGIEAVDKLGQGSQGADGAAGGDVDIDPEGRQPCGCIELGVGMGGNVAFVQVPDNGTLPPAALLYGIQNSFVLVQQRDDTGAPGIVVLGGYVDKLRVYDSRHFFDYSTQAVRIVFLVDVFEIFELGFGRSRVADIVYVEAQGLCQIVEPFQAHLAPPYVLDQFGLHLPAMF